MAARIGTIAGHSLLMRTEPAQVAGNRTNTCPNQQTVSDENAFVFGQIAAGNGRRNCLTAPRVQALLYETVNPAPSMQPAMASIHVNTRILHAAEVECPSFLS